MLRHLQKQLPVISGLRGEARTLMESNRAGLYYNPSDAYDLKAKILQLMKSELYAELSRNARRLYDTVLQGDEVYRNFVRYIEIPKISTKELEVALPIEAGKFIPFPMGEESISYRIVPPLSNDIKKMGVTFVAIPRGKLKTT